jgi:hypothetical protein
MRCCCYYCCCNLPIETARCCQCECCLPLAVAKGHSMRAAVLGLGCLGVPAALQGRVWEPGVPGGPCSGCNQQMHPCLMFAGARDPRHSGPHTGPRHGPDNSSASTYNSSPCANNTCARTCSQADHTCACPYPCPKAYYPRARACTYARS